MSYASTITGVPSGWNKMPNTSIFSGVNNPSYIPINGLDGSVSITANNINVSSINEYSQNNWWNLANYNRGTTASLTFGAVSTGSGLVAGTGALTQNVCKGGQSYYMNIPAEVEVNLQNLVSSSLITTTLGFSTGTLRLNAGSLYAESDDIYSHLVSYSGILDCPFDNAPLVGFAQTAQNLVGQTIINSPASGTFVYGKIANTSN